MTRMQVTAAFVMFAAAAITLGTVVVFWPFIISITPQVQGVFLAMGIVGLLLMFGAVLFSRLK